MRHVVAFVACCAFVVLTMMDAEAARRRLFGGCSNPYVSTGYCVTYYPTCQTITPCRTEPVCDPCKLIDTGPLKDLKIVLEPTYFTEKRSICTTEYRKEKRHRVIKVCREVPVEEERITTETVWVPTTETKTIEYTVKVPMQHDKVVEYTTTEAVWTEVPEDYMVKVPFLKDVEERYPVKVPMVKDVEFTYCVNVPHPEIRTVTRSVNTVEPVEQTRTISHCIPVVKTKMVDRDYGHWENRIEEVQVQCGCYRRYHCRSCGGCGYHTSTVCKRVWVPRKVKEEVSYVEEHHKHQTITYIAYEQHHQNVEHECVYVCYKPETRKGTKQVVTYDTVMHTRTKKVVDYRDEPRTRTKKKLTFKEVPRSETYPVVTYVDEPRTKDITYKVNVPETRTRTHKVTRYDTVVEDDIETYMANVPVPVVREVEVRICRMVPKVVPITINPCGGGYHHAAQKHHVQKSHAVQKHHEPHHYEPHHRDHDHDHHHDHHHDHAVQKHHVPHQRVPVQKYAVQK